MLIIGLKERDSCCCHLHGVKFHIRVRSIHVQAAKAGVVQDW